MDPKRAALMSAATMLALAATRIAESTDQASRSMKAFTDVLSTRPKDYNEFARDVPIYKGSRIKKAMQAEAKEKRRKEMVAAKKLNSIEEN